MKNLTKEQEAIRAAKKKFHQDYSHLWTDGKSDGLYGVGIGWDDAKKEVIVVMGTSQVVLDKVPDTYQGFKISKRLGDIPRAL